jgi:Bacterial membrane protein YfhO
VKTLKLARPPARVLDAAALLALLGLVLLFNPDLAFRGMVPGGYDTFVYFYPLRAYFAQAAAEGRLPLWNPHLFLGVPFLANPQAAVFYLGTLLFLLLQVPYAYVANLLAHVFLAGASLYAFARGSLGLGRLGSLLGAAAFAFSGFLGGQAGHLNQLSVAAWLPLVAFALDLALRGGRPRAFALLVGGLVLQLLAGHPQEVYMTLVVLGLLVIWRRWGDGPAALTRGLALLALAAALAFGISAIQLLPTAELSRLSIRGAGLEFDQAVDNALPWQLLLPALFPGFWSHLHTTEFFGHLSTIVLVLGWLGLLAGPARPAALGGLLVGLGLLLAVGDTTPLYRFLFEWAPGFGSFRVPARWLFIYTFGASLLVAVGTSWLVEVSGVGYRVSGTRPPGTWHPTPDTRFVLVGLGVPLALAVLVFLGQRQSRLLLLIWGGLTLVTLLLAACAILLPRLRGPAVAALLIGGLAELWLAGADLEYRYPTPNLAYRQPRESTEFLRSVEGLDGRFRMLSIASPDYEVKETPEYRERFPRLHPRALENLFVAVKWNESLVPNVPLEYRLDTADGYDGGVLPLADFARLTRAMLPDRARLDGVLASRLDHLPEARWLDLLGVRYVLAGRIKDLTHDGLYYDRAITATLRPGERLELRGLPLGEFTRLGLISSFRGPSRPGGEVARLELSGGEAGPTIVPLLDGTHTAASDRGPGTVDPSSASLEPVQEWAAGDWGGGTDWVTQIPFARRPITGLVVANTTTDLVFEMRSLNLVDDVRQASFSLTLDDRIERTEFFDMKVYDRRDALPRAYLVSRAVVLDDALALRRLAEPDFEPRQTVLLAPVEDARTLEGDGSIPGSAELAVNEAEQLRIPTRAAAPSYLVISDSWYPGWRATVDGLDVPILRANVLFRAVEVPVGEHLVELTYQPTSFRLGAALSAVSLLVGLVLWAVAGLRRGSA